MLRVFSVIIVIVVLAAGVFAQDRKDSLHSSKPDTAKHRSDTTRHRPDTTKVEGIIDDIKNTEVSKQLVKTITRRPTHHATVTVRSEEVFMPYQGKIIRDIVVTHLGFERSVTDTTKRIRTAVTHAANAIHSNSKEWLIRDNLFIKENRPVNPYKMADNERYLRDLDFILDARFYIIPLGHTEDSVDVIVITRDVFSIGGSFSPRGATKTSFKLYDVNLLGAGQRVQFTGLIDEPRRPAFGYELLFRKNSIGGSFVTMTAAYTQLNGGSSYGDELEKAYYIKLERPLVSPYTRLAGGMELSRNWSKNYYGEVDTIFRDYAYLVNDVWIGYNLGANQNMHDRNRHVVAIRAFDQHFLRQPLQSFEGRNVLYNNRTFLLGSLTIFKQNFYTARYIYGFGRTEDLPYGHNVSFNFGWARQMGLERPYLGLDATKSFVHKTGRFYNLSFRAGGFPNSGFEDATILLSGSVASRLVEYKKLMIRQTVGAGITQIYKPRASLPLDINNELGLRGFVADSLWGTKRLHLNAETVVFTPIKILGFNIAPFTAVDAALLSKKNEGLFRNKPYGGVGGGLRTRNENLVFGTIEFRVMYYPRTVEDISNINIKLSSNLRVKYTASFVKPPSFVVYN
jgi:hypothetical protein